MLYYEQSSHLVLGNPNLFGKNDFFSRHAFGRPLSKADIFRIRLVSGKISGSTVRGRLPIRYDHVPLHEVETAALLNGSGLEADFREHIFQEEDMTPDCYIFIPEFWQNIYGHWLVDILPGAVAARNLLGDVKIRLLHSSSIPEFAYFLAENFGFDRMDFVSLESLDLGKSYNFAIYSALREHDYFNKTIMSAHFTKILRELPLSENEGPDRVYISRSNWRRSTPNSRSLENRDNVEVMFREAGYTIVYPEQLSIMQQILLFRGVKILAGEAGSGLHNSVFMQNGTHVICIQSGRQNHLIQASLCSVCGQTSSYVVGRQESADWNSNFLVDLNDIEDVITATS